MKIKNPSNTETSLTSPYKLIMFDLDGVLTAIESSWCWVHDHFGVDNEDSLRAFLAGEIDDLEFMRRDIGLWLQRKGKVHISEIEKILANAPLTTGLVETMQTLRCAGIRTAIVSGGLELLALRITKTAKIDYVYANGLKTDPQGYLTGEGILNVELADKSRVARALIAREGLQPQQAAAIGDSFLDIPMFKVCGLGIAFNPKDERVRSSANIVVESTDLRAILPYIFSVPKNFLSF
jgi:phosphoserine phosphatase